MAYFLYENNSIPKSKSQKNILFVIPAKAGIQGLTEHTFRFCLTNFGVPATVSWMPAQGAGMTKIF
jgi:hypothetical protein